MLFPLAKVNDFMPGKEMMILGLVDSGNHRNLAKQLRQVEHAVICTSNPAQFVRLQSFSISWYLLICDANERDKCKTENYSMLVDIHTLKETSGKRGILYTCKQKNEQNLLHSISQNDSLTPFSYLSQIHSSLSQKSTATIPCHNSQLASET